ncbi:MAG: sensor histidine kinase, partial [Balneolaceae bacterium]|nr:sensor histidine kinase [Balneolaceae bacterium]
SDKLSEIDLKTYFNDLLSAIENTVDSVMNVDIDLKCDGIFLNVNQALPSALIVNELISNSLKHAFDGASINEPTILLDVSEANEKVMITVKDNGVGMPEIFEEDYSMGYNIIHTLIDQLEADLKISSKDGTAVSFSFKKREVRGAASALI